MTDLVIADNTAGSPDTAPVSGTPAYFTEGNPGLSIPATVLPGWFMNMIMVELRNISVAGRETPSRFDWEQAWRGILALHTFFDAGSTNALVISPVSPLTMPAIPIGAEITIIPAHTNTGASTLTFGSVSANIVRPNGAGLLANDLIALYPYKLLWNGVTWVLLFGDSLANNLLSSSLTADIVGASSGALTARTLGIGLRLTGNTLDVGGVPRLLFGVYGTGTPDPYVTNWTVPADTYQLYGICVGGGGAGAGVGLTYSGGGGGSGGFASGWFNVTPGDVLTITVGNGGEATTGVPAGSDGPDGAGSSISGAMSADGGGGGASTTSAAGGFAGIGHGGTLFWWGGSGGDGSVKSTTYLGGNGGASYLGGGTRASTTSTHSFSAPGSGGGGGYGGTSGLLDNLANGAAGADGAVLIYG